MHQRIRFWFSSLFIAAIFSAGAAAADVAPDHVDKFVFHITDNNSARGLLNNARNLLDGYEGKVKLVVVANGGGVDFLLQEAADKNGNPYSIAIENLQGKGVEFRVCNNTLNSRKIDPKKLVDGAQLVPAGIIEVTRLQAREGYSYIKP